MKYQTLIIFCLIAFLTSCKIGRFFIYNFADINDHKKFPSRELKPADEPFQFHRLVKERTPKSINYDQGKSIKFETFLEENKTVAFLLIKKDTLMFDSYFGKYDSSKVVASFSMAKSFTSLLIGCAIADGLIQSVNEPVKKYLPTIHSDFDSTTIEQLLQMTSGMKFNESYVNPFGHAATFYYGRNLKKAVNKLKIEEEYIGEFDYVSGSTQMLGSILDQILEPSNRTITDYMNEKIWIPMGVEYPASWSLDKKNGIEKTFCCINATAIDFAKIGRLMLNKGMWEGQQIVSKDWVEQSTKIDTTNGSAPNYQYQWWLSGPNAYSAEGILGQYIYVDPIKEIIIVRLGKNYGNVNWKSVFKSLAANY